MSNINNPDYSKPISFQTLVYRVVFEQNLPRTTSYGQINVAPIAALAMTSFSLYSSSLGPNVIEKYYDRNEGKNHRLLEFFIGSSNFDQTIKKAASSTTTHPISTTLQFGRFLKLQAEDFDEKLLLLLKKTPYFAKSLQKLTIAKPKSQRFMKNAIEGMTRLEEIVINDIPASSASSMSRAFPVFASLPALSSISLHTGHLPLNEDFFQVLADVGEKHEKIPGAAVLRKLELSAKIATFNEIDSDAFQTYFADGLCKKNILTHLTLDGIPWLVNDDFKSLTNAKMTNLQFLSLKSLGEDHPSATNTELVRAATIVNFIKSASSKNLKSLVIHNVKCMHDDQLKDLFTFHEGGDFGDPCCPEHVDIKIGKPDSHRPTWAGSARDSRFRFHQPYSRVSFLELLKYGSVVSSQDSNEKAVEGDGDRGRHFFENLQSFKYEDEHLSIGPAFVVSLYKFSMLRVLNLLPGEFDHEAFSAVHTPTGGVFLSGLNFLESVSLWKLKSRVPEDVQLLLPISSGRLRHVKLTMSIHNSHIPQLISSSSLTSSGTLVENALEHLEIHHVQELTKPSLALFGKLPWLEQLSLSHLGPRGPSSDEAELAIAFIDAREQERRRWAGQNEFTDTVFSYPISYTQNARFSRRDFDFDNDGRIIAVRGKEVGGGELAAGDRRQRAE